jgi:hypothetical protein
MMVIKDNRDIEKSIRLLRKFMESDGDLRRLRDRERFIRRGEKVRMKHKRAVIRLRKNERKHE